MKKGFDYATNLCEFLNGNYYRFVIVISKNQYAMGIDTALTHEGMLVDLIKRIRPNMEIDGFGNAINKNDSYTNDSIVVMGEKGYMSIQLPNRDRISKEQFDCLTEILYYVKNYNYMAECSNNDIKYEIVAFGNDDISLEAKDYSDNIEELLNNIEKYVVPPAYLPNEVIIGRKFDVKLLSASERANLLIEKMVNNSIDTSGNPILGENSEYRLKGYSSILFLILFSLLSSIIIFSLGIFMILN